MCGVCTVRLYTVAALAAYLAFAPCAAEQPPPPASLTPGRVALLGNKLDDEAIGRLRAGLSDPDPLVRAVAARVAGIARVTALPPAVADALGRERDEMAAAEMLRALIFFDTAETRAAVDRYVQQAKGPAAGVYFEWFARGPVDRVAERAEELLAVIGKADDQLAPALARTIFRNRDAAQRLLRAWLRAASPQGWRSVLDYVGGDFADAEVPVMTEALAASHAETRAETVWAIVRRLALGLPVAAATLDAATAAADGARPPEADGQVSRELVGREIIARRHRKAQTPDRAPFLKAQGNRYQSDLRALLGFPELTPSELGAVRDALGPMASKLPLDVPREQASIRIGRRTSMRILPVLSPRVLSDVLEVSKCGVQDRARFSFYEISYRPDGRPASLTLEPGLSEPCFAAVSALGRMTLADPMAAALAGKPQIVVVPMHREHVECVSTATAAPPARIGTPVGGASPGRLEPPKKVRDVRPVYPEPARQARLQGMVVIESMITGTGCVTDAVVLSSVHPSLDYAAMQAVSQWKFSPTLLNGVAVPVIMTVTVNFKLG